MCRGTHRDVMDSVQCNDLCIILGSVKQESLLTQLSLILSQYYLKETHIWGSLTFSIKLHNITSINYVLVTLSQVR